MAITCPTNDSVGVCGTMDSAGAGLGVFIQYLGQSLPVLLIILAIVGVIVAVGFGVAKVVGNSMQTVTKR